MAQIHQLFKRAMDRYGVQSKQLADLAEISAVHLSEFRNGRKWLSQDVFESLLEGMEQLSPGSKRYFCELLAGEQLREKEDNVLTLIR
ncbi:MAG: XRE family transcriptional regulator, partial [Nostoc sp.]